MIYFILFYDVASIRTTYFIFALVFLGRRRLESFKDVLRSLIAALQFSLNNITCVFLGVCRRRFEDRPICRE